MLATWFRRTIRRVPRWDAAHDARRDQGEPVRMAILRELLRRRDEREPPPTWEELGAVVGLTGETAKYHSKRLRARGLVNYQHGHTRTLMITEAGEAAIRPEH